jgi:hypothetical protein
VYGRARIEIVCGELRRLVGEAVVGLDVHDVADLSAFDQLPGALHGWLEESDRGGCVGAERHRLLDQRVHTASAALIARGAWEAGEVRTCSTSGRDSPRSASTLP